MTKEPLKPAKTATRLRIVLALLTGFVIVTSLVLAALDRPLAIVIVCASALLVVAVFSIALSRVSAPRSDTDNAGGRHRAGLWVTVLSTFIALVGLISLLFDSGVLPQFALVLGIGGVAGGAFVVRTARNELRNTSSV